MTGGAGEGDDVALREAVFSAVIELVDSEAGGAPFQDVVEVHMGRLLTEKEAGSLVGMASSCVRRPAARTAW